MADVNDARHLDTEVENEWGRLEAADIPEQDREFIEAYASYREGRVSRNTLRQDMGNLRRAAEANPKDTLVDCASPTDVDRIISNLSGVNKPETKNTYNRALRQFYKWLRTEPGYDKDDYEWIEGVEDYESENGNRLKLEDYLGADEISELLEAAEHPREEALIEFLADTGARVNVVCNLRRGDVNVEGARPTYQPNPNAKDGYKGVEIKRYPLIYSERHLRRWLNLHHPDDHPDAPLFPVKEGYDTADRQNMAMHPQTVFSALRRLADKTDVDPKRVHPHAFRHAAVRRMKTDPDFDFDWETVKLRTAWSDRAFNRLKELYGALEEEEQLDYVFRRSGKEIEADDEGEPITRECHNCGEEARREATYCPRCGRAFELEGVKQELEGRKEEAGTLDRYKLLDKLAQEVESDPELLEKLLGD